MAKKAKKPVPQGREEASIKSFLDMIAPSVVSFMPDHFICGNTFRCVWALREYPTSTDEQAILRHLGEKDGVTLRIYTRQVTPAEEKRIIQNAANKNRMNSSNTNDLQQTVTAESNLQDVATLVATMHRNREPLLHCAVYIELTASDYNSLKLLQTDVLTELVRSKLNVDIASAPRSRLCSSRRWMPIVRPAWVRRWRSAARTICRSRARSPQRCRCERFCCRCQFASVLFVGYGDSFSKAGVTLLCRTPKRKI